MSNSHRVRLAQVKPEYTQHGERIEIVRRRLSAHSLGRQLGCSHHELPKGARSWPRHYHASNEEALYILEGVGTIEIRSEKLSLSAGDYVALPAGPEHVHQIFNNGEQPLKYLCFSTMHATDLVVYPDSNKIGIFAGSAPGGAKEERFIQGFFQLGRPLSYFQCEPEEG